MKTHKPILSSIRRLSAFGEPKRPARRRKPAAGVLLAGFFTLLGVVFVPELAHAANGADTRAGNTSTLFSTGGWTGVAAMKIRAAEMSPDTFGHNQLLSLS